MGKEAIETKGCKLLLLHSSLLALVDVLEFQTTEVYSSLNLNRVKYNI
jgi:hypothetical protein